MPTTTRRSTSALPVPRKALRQLGLTEAQIKEAERAEPLVVACQASKHPGARFDVDRVKRALRALSKFKHTKGRWAGLPISLQAGGLDPWQIVWVIAPIFGWVYFDDEAGRMVRVVRTAWIEVPRKNGKSTLSSGLLNVLLLADGEAGAEVYAAAGSKEQAGRVFDDAKRMAQTAPAARKRIEFLKELMKTPRLGGIFRVLSRVAEVAHGLNVSGACIDEVHTLRLRRALVEAIETGTGARDQPLIVFITTADEAEEGTIYDEKHGYTRKVADAIVEDPSWYGVIWAAEDDDDPFVEATWRKANPGLGKSPTMAYMRREAQRAKATPSRYPAFCRLHLNRRMRESTLWFKIEDWDKSTGAVDWKKLKGRRAWGGLDLSAVSDFTAWWVGVDSPNPNLELEGRWRFWIPEDRVEELEEQLLVPLKKWIADGWVTVTEGNVIDYAKVAEQVIADCKHFDMQTVSYDRMFAGQMVQELDAALKGVTVDPVAQSYQGLSPACKELERLLGWSERARRNKPQIRHDANPVARWMASVVEVRRDNNDNMRPIKPDRAKASARIDGLQAEVTGLDGYVRRPKKRTRYAYTA